MFKGKYNKWKITFLVTLPALLFLIILETYIIVNTAVSLTYTQDQLEKNTSDLRVLARIFPNERKKGELVKALKATFPNMNIVDDGNKVHFADGLTFVFNSDDTLQSIITPDVPNYKK